MNRLREIFNPTFTPKEKETLNKIAQVLKDEKHCGFCVHAEMRPHYEMGYNAGADVYCNKFNELRIDDPTGQQCLFWQEYEVENGK